MATMAQAMDAKTLFGLQLTHNRNCVMHGLMRRLQGFKHNGSAFILRETVDAMRLQPTNLAPSPRGSARTQI